MGIWSREVFEKLFGKQELRRLCRKAHIKY